MIDLVSIVVPVYNGELFLQENIKCISKQTYTNLEIIYVCAGCTDGSINILQEYQQFDPRIKLYVEEENHGPAVSRNIGMEMANGEWIIFLDCDDLFEQNMIEIMLEQAVKEKADICCCFWDVFDKESFGRVGVKNTFLKSCCKTYPIVYVENEKQHLFQMQMVHANVWSKLVHKNVYKKEIVCFMQFPNCEDLYYSLAAAMEASKIVYVDQVLVHYRKNEDRATQTTMMDSQKSYIWEVLDLVFYHICKKEDNCKLKQSFYNCVCKNIFSLYTRSKIYDTLFNDLYNIYFEKWGMREADIEKKLSYFNQEIYKKVYVHDMQMNVDEIKQRAEVHFIKDIADKGKCSIWGCGYRGQRLIEKLNDEDIKIYHLYDSDREKCGINLFGKKVEQFVGDTTENIIVPNALYYEEIKKQVGNRAFRVYNLQMEIMLC